MKCSAALSHPDEHVRADARKRLEADAASRLSPKAETTDEKLQRLSGGPWTADEKDGVHATEASGEGFKEASLAASAALIGVSEGDADTIFDAVEMTGEKCWAGLVRYVASLRAQLAERDSQIAQFKIELEEVSDFGRREELQRDNALDEYERQIAQLRGELQAAERKLYELEGRLTFHNFTSVVRERDQANAQIAQLTTSAQEPDESLGAAETTTLENHVAQLTIDVRAMTEDRDREKARAEDYLDKWVQDIDEGDKQIQKEKERAEQLTAELTRAEQRAEAWREIAIKAYPWRGNFIMYTPSLYEKAHQLDKEAGK